MSGMEDLFYKRCESYFGKKEMERFKEKMKEPCSQGLFLNEKKAKKEDILKEIDFPLTPSPFCERSYYHKEDSIGKTKVNDLGLIYPQEVSASIPAMIPDVEGVKIALDMCSAPGGKSINLLNRLSEDTLLIANEIEYKRAQVLVSNLERLGFGNVIITSKKTGELARDLKGVVDLILLDAPCSGEGMIRKYPEILNEYSLANIETCAKRQSIILEDAYICLKTDGTLVYSTCTYASEEDESQVEEFLKKHPDMKLIPIEGYPDEVTKDGMLKFSPLNDSEGQFVAHLVKMGEGEGNVLSLKKTVRQKTVDTFIQEQLDLEEYYLYEQNGHYYLSLQPLPKVEGNVLRFGIYLGDLIKDRFEPSHHFYRANLLQGKYRHVYELKEEEYHLFIEGQELEVDCPSGYHQITYHGHSLGFGKCSNGRMKNKYPKGLRRMV